MRYPSTFSALLLSAILPAAAYAQNDDSHGDHGSAGDIVVTAILGRSQSDLLAGTTVLTDEVLSREMRPTIGETLSRQAGVSATSFGPNASRPVLRGFQGERVRVLSDGIGSFDVSNTSVDHAVVINPLNADRIEVLRGPSALLFGSSAIGGVVNVIDSRIPREKPEEGFHADAIATLGSAANERTGGIRLDLPVSGLLVAHLDASYSKSGNLRTGGAILTPALRATAAASGDAQIEELAGLRGELPNSGARTWEVAGGFAIIKDNGNLGVSLSRYDSLYGVPVRYALVPGTEAEAVRLDVRQTRLDVRSEIKPDAGFLSLIRFRGGYADYRHDELEETGAIGTSFFSNGWEGRVELVQRDRGGWQGAFGGQALLRDVRIVGVEKFLPAVTNRQFGIFTVQSVDLGVLRAEAGGRIESSRASAKEDADIGNPAMSRTFTAVSGSLGANYELADRWRIGLNASYTQRAPSPEELFANGPHAGTQAFEIGDPSLSKERSKGLELTLRGGGNGYSLSASLYHSWFSSFIYEAPTGLFEDDLPVFEVRQASARHYGLEFEASARLARIGNFDINLDGLGDYSRATLRGIGPVPRIPALRLLGGIEAQSDRITGRVETEWVDGQTRLAAFETPTKGYTMVNASLNMKPLGDAAGLDITLSANNIFDVVGRRHASFLKDYAPLAGRDVRLSARLAF